MILFEAHEAVTPFGNPLIESIPVALMVKCVISVNAEPSHKVGLDEAAAAKQEGIALKRP